MHPEGYSGAMLDWTEDDFWREYQSASTEYQRALDSRLRADREVVNSRSAEALELWNEAHRAEEKCFEQLKAAARVIWAKYKQN